MVYEPGSNKKRSLLIKAQVSSARNGRHQLKSGFQPGKALIAVAYDFGQLGAFRAS
jgi:hypothetical protein